MLALLVGIGAVPAAAEVGLLPIVVASADQQRGTELRSSLEVEIADVLNRRLVKVTGARTCADEFSEQCALDIATATSAPLDEVALITVDDRPGGGFVVDITVRETGEGKRVFHAKVRQAPSDGPGVVGSALRRAFDPKSWAGRIAVTGAPDDAEVLIDGLRAAGPTTVRVGEHHVVVRTPGGADRVLVAQVEPGEVATVRIDAAASVAGASPLPTIALGVLGAVATGAAVAFGGLELWYEVDSVNVAEEGEQANLVDRQVSLARDARLGGAVPWVDPSRTGWLSGYGSTVPDLTRAAQLAQRASAHGEMVADEALRTMYGAVAVGAAVVAVASVAGALVAWPEGPTEDAATATTPTP
ncbi:MAG: hypothetical protein A2138_13355 [Deltaproteobacteria bacterium RBG_16_71_12]|nr:MAG: hypothetical protein A2138_13355 [Deltaproteobacteria bacterium RBG_16_71_12]